MKFTAKYFFLADVLVLWGQLRLEFSCIWVNTVLAKKKIDCIF